MLVKGAPWYLPCNPSQNHTCWWLAFLCSRIIYYISCTVLDLTLTLSQWSSSGNPVAIQCAWNLDSSVHRNTTGEMPVCFQWSSSGFIVVFQCVPIMQINTGSPLEHHWVLASASVVPVVSQCTCGSSGLPVRSVQWYPSVLTESGLEVIGSLGQVTSQHATPNVYNCYGESCLS